MPNAVLTINKSIFDIKDENMFFDGKSVLLYPVVLEKEAFFIRLYQNKDRVVVKLEKSTMPKITDRLKDYIMRFVLKLENRLDGKILHHNLNATHQTDYELYDKYEITPPMINESEYINSLCKHKNISLEIGMGSGEFLTNKALNNKNEGFIGVEILNRDFNIALRRFYSACLDNTKAIRFDARAVLDRFKPNSLNNIYINFPEPWFKSRRIKHSVLTVKTAKEVERILSLDGALSILTDNYPFAVSAAAIIENSTRLQKANRHSIVVTSENIKTKYEKKWIRYKRTIYKLQYVKRVETNGFAVNGFEFPIKVQLTNKITKDYVFKVLNIYSNVKKSQRIVEIAAGYAKNPQHIFFGLKNDNTLEVLPQSNFIVNSDFIKAVSL